MFLYRIKDDFEKYEKRAVSKAIKIHIEEGPGDILVFLCSPVEIMRCCKEFERKMADHSNFKYFLLHCQLSNNQQRKVFDKFPVDHRKIVFATNCAETSITIYWSFFK